MSSSSPVQRYQSAVSHAQNVLDEFDRINNNTTPTSTSTPPPPSTKSYKNYISNTFTSNTPSPTPGHYSPQNSSYSSTSSAYSTARPSTSNAFRPDAGDQVRVSSVLFQQEGKHGAHHMFDNDPGTSWSSDRGTTQWLVLTFAHAVRVHELRITFKRGLAARTMTLVDVGASAPKEVEQFWPENSDEEQSFPVTTLPLVKFQQMKLQFNTSYDYGGHIEIVKLEVIGERCG